MSNRKVKGGTPDFSKPNLCLSCKHATLMKGTAESEEFTYCQSLERFVPIKITDCSSHENKIAMSMYTMQSIAWNLCVDKRGNHIGFLSPKDLYKRCDEVTVAGNPITDEY